MQRRELLFITVLCSVFFIVRLYIATLSSYPFFHGWNEGHYSLIAKGYFEHPLLIPERDGIINWAVPPFYSWIVFAFFNIFGISDISARLTSIFAAVIATFSTYVLAKELYDKKIAALSSLLFVLIPWVVLLFGRVKTDMTMTAFMTASIACFVYACKRNRSFLPVGIFFGLALFTKQPSVLILAIIIVWLLLINEKRVLLKLVVPIAVGTFPILTYIVYHASSGNIQGVLQLVYGEAVYRTALFSDWRNTLAGLVVGISPLILIFASYEIYKSRNIRSILVIWLVVYGIFVLARTPPSHEYYVLPLAPPFAILSAKGIYRLREWNSLIVSSEKLVVLSAVFVLFSAILVSLVFLQYTGDLGYMCTEDVVEYLKNLGEDKVTILTPDRYAPQLEWYCEMKGLDAEVVSLPNDLSLRRIQETIGLPDKDRMFLVIDGRGGFEERLDYAGYKPTFISYYNTSLPSIFSSLYTGEKNRRKTFEQHLSVYEVK